jgi:hypothetical protein
MTLISFDDSRTDRLGLTFDLDEKVLAELCAHVGVPEDVEVRIRLTEKDVEGEGQGGAMILAESECSPVTYSVGVATSDRLEFTNESIRRVNRNLAHELRHVAQANHLIAFYGLKLGAALWASSWQVHEADAYMSERSMKDRPELWPLTPEVVIEPATKKA